MNGFFVANSIPNRSEESRGKSTMLFTAVSPNATEFSRFHGADEFNSKLNLLFRHSES